MDNTKWQAAPWRKSTHSPDWDDCVELAPGAETIGVRDSKNPLGPVIELTQDGLADLLERVRAGLVAL